MHYQPSRIASNKQKKTHTHTQSPKPTECKTTGVTRLLVLDIIKPDYSHIRQQLDFYQGGSNVVANEAPFEINLFDIQQSVSRVFGKYHTARRSSNDLHLVAEVSFFILAETKWAHCVCALLTLAKGGPLEGVREQVCQQNCELLDN